MLEMIKQLFIVKNEINARDDKTAFHSKKMKLMLEMLKKAFHSKK